MIGTTLKHYRITEKIGEGGMGVVYRAIDSHLDRTVAIKVLRAEAMGDAERKWRFVREAKAASALNHPHIVTIHDIDAEDGVDFMVMEALEGTPLDRLIPKEGLPVAQALDYGEQIASALGAAHAAGIVHRDVKPANVHVSPKDRVKVLDFGLAKLVEPDAALTGATTDSTATAAAAAARTQQGAILGTIAYMSPEQALGKPVDARSDVFSLGSVLYEMLAGRRPFQGDSHLLTLTAILRDPPVPIGSVRPDVPARVEAILRRSLEKRPEDRYPSAAEMEKDLAAARRESSKAGAEGRFRIRPRTIAAALLLLAAAGTWFLVRNARAREAREVLLPEIERLTEQGKPGAAVRLARQAERDAPEEVERLRRDVWRPARIRTEPPGAAIAFQDYLDPDGPWLSLGSSPVETRLPQGYFRWKIEKPGFAPLVLAGGAGGFPQPIRLDPESSAPAGMVRIASAELAVRSLDSVRLDAFWLDKYEVTNRQFKEFVDAGGYEKKQYWKPAFFRDGREISWEEARKLLVDTTGRPGPATWELGSFPEGREDYPVNGVSWYEAAAFAEFAGKSLPTIYHWYRAAGEDNFSQILHLSNFGGKEPSKVGSHAGLSAEGAYDMAGNVKEWCWNENAGRRYLLGGSYAEPNYTFLEADAQAPFDRSPRNGFRCARYETPLRDETLTRPTAGVSRDYNLEKPVSDEVFAAYRSVYAYDKGPLDAREEGPVTETAHWRRQRVSYASAGGTRIPADIFLPKNARPPYQTVLYFPSNTARTTASSDDMDLRHVEYVIRSGRALLFPIYQDTHERRLERRPVSPNRRRDLVIEWSKEVGRSLDYLETRKDVDRQKLAFYGVSLGAKDGVVFIALEDRFRTAVLLAAGLRFARYPPEVEPINFAPRVRIPVLVISGRYDFSAPYETAQAPLLRLLGAPEKDKRHVVFEGGHVPTQMQPIIKEILDWLDRYLGRVAAE